MSAYTMNCPPTDCGPCGTLPTGFVRLRYFYGKRLGVADLVDEQRYHAGKLRFHNQRLHGSGVLCGLRAELFSTDPADVTVLRIRRGAALDACGREIVVGYEQCLDVAAWLARKVVEDATFLDGVGATLPLCVVLRYRECGSHPEPAPRDPCSCDAAGCELGRIREEFELQLIKRPDVMIVPAIFPARDKVDTALAGAVGGSALFDALGTLATEACPAPDTEGWIELACLDARLGPDPTDPTAPRRVVALEALEQAASILYETALLQDLLRRELAATVEAGALLDGPEIVGLALEDVATPTKLILGVSAELEPSTVESDAFSLHAFAPGTGWTAVAVSTVYVASPPRLEVTLAPATVAAGDKYRLVSRVPADQPIVDGNMSPLRPLRFSYHFQIQHVDPADPTTKLVVAPIAP